jgi:two-component system OmpR family sensor kinase
VTETTALTTVKMTERQETTTDTTPRQPPPPRRRLLGLRLRLLGWSLTLLTLATLISLVVVRQVLLNQLESRVTADLRQETDDFSRVLRENNPATGRPYGADLRTAVDRYLARNAPQDAEAVFTFIGGRFYRGTTEAPADLSREAELTRQWTGSARPRFGAVSSTPAGEAHWLAVPVIVNGQIRAHFVVAQFTGPVREGIDAVVRLMAIACLLVPVLAAAGGYAAMGRVLRPLRTVTETARRIEETDLSGRIEADGADEVADLARTFNAMLDRLERAFEVQRAFVSDAGHELRTPITVVRGHLELMGDDPRERRETIALVTDELDRMNRMVNDLLLLAKAEQPDFLRLQEVVVAELVRDVFAKTSALGGRDWRLGPVADTTLPADPQRLTQALMQLAENAVRHTGPADVIEVCAAAYDDRVHFTVRDSGCGIEPAEQERIFERFARGGPGRARSEGAGLGLAIVRVIAEAHRGTVSVDSSPGAGSAFTLAIPREAAR